MTTTYDPHHAAYTDEADVRNEMSRVFDVCQGCRRCVDLCGSFPTLFSLLDRFEDRDAGRLTPAEQDRVVDQCYQCKLCHLDCPYVPGRHAAAVDFPRLMLRADAMRRANGQVPLRDRWADRFLGRPGLIGRMATSLPLVAKLADGTPGSARRRVVAKLTGVSAVRLLPPYAKERFSTWFARRPLSAAVIAAGGGGSKVTVFPTCVVEYHEPGIGRALVGVYERNGVECEISRAGCCGAPWLHAGDVERFTELAGKNVERLAAEVRNGTDIVVPQPTCSYVLRRDYPDYVGGPDAELVAANTYDAAEYLMLLHERGDTALDTDFAGDVPSTITYHSPCHLRAQEVGSRSRDLLQLTGATVTVIEQCSGVDGAWGLRAGNEAVSIPVAERLGAQIASADGERIAGDCHLANTAITEQTGSAASHPLQLIARAYGLDDA